MTAISAAIFLVSANWNLMTVQILNQVGSGRLGVAAAFSIVTIVLFWNAFVAFFPNKVGALGVDIAVLVCLLVLNWPTEAMLGY